MSVMTMNMCSGKSENEKPQMPEYDEEIMCAGWNPALGLAQWAPEDRHRAFPSELANVDIEQFLKKMYG